MLSFRLKKQTSKNVADTNFKALKLKIKVMIDFTILYVLMASLAKWLSVRLGTKWLWVRVPLELLDFTIP